MRIYSIENTAKGKIELNRLDVDQEVYTVSSDEGVLYFLHFTDAVSYLDALLERVNN